SAAADVHQDEPTAARSRLDVPDANPHGQPTAGSFILPFIMASARSICVFCGSSTRVEQRFLDVGADMGTRIAGQGWDLIYGGGSIGLMGETARAVHRGGGKVVGVIPQSMDSDEI